MNRMQWMGVAIALASTSVWAEVQVAKPKSDADNYRNDSVRFDVDLSVKKLRLGDGATSTPGCLPGGAELYGLGKVLVTAADGKTPEERALFRVVELAAKPEFQTACKAESKDDKDRPVAKGEVVALAPGTLDTHHARRGWTYGALSVPYKLQLRGDRGQGSGGALGGYVGGRFMWSGLSNQLVGFVGLTKVDVPVTKDGKPATDQIAGISYGLGLLTTVKGSFQAGIVLGFDKVPRSSGYAYNDKPWLSVSLGHSFTE